MGGKGKENLTTNRESGSSDLLHEINSVFLRFQQ